MNCQSARELIAETLAVSREELTREIAGHIQSCAECRTFYAQQAELFRAMDSGLGAMVNEAVPPSFLPRVRALMAETHTVSPWFYRLLPAAAVLVIACLIAFPFVRRSFRSGGVEVAVIPERSENGGEPRQPLAGQPEKSPVPPATGEQSPRHSARPPAAQRPAQTAGLAVLVTAEESQGLLQLAAAVQRSPQWAQAMVHPTAPPASQIAPIEPVEIANLEVNPLSEESQ
jgi:hypothetical protein